MLFVATLTHDLEHCWARDENEEKAQRWLAGIPDRAEERGVEVRGSYITPAEHTLYMVLEADSYADVVRFLTPSLLEDHDGHVAPVMSLQEGATLVFEDEDDEDGRSEDDESPGENAGSI